MLAGRSLHVPPRPNRALRTVIGMCRVSRGWRKAIMEVISSWYSTSTPMLMRSVYEIRAACHMRRWLPLVLQKTTELWIRIDGCPYTAAVGCSLRCICRAIGSLQHLVLVAASLTEDGDREQSDCRIRPFIEALPVKRVTFRNCEIELSNSPIAVIPVTVFDASITFVGCTFHNSDGFPVVEQCLTVGDGCYRYRRCLPTFEGCSFYG